MKWPPVFHSKIIDPASELVQPSGPSKISQRDVVRITVECQHFDVPRHTALTHHQQVNVLTFLQRRSDGLNL